MTAQQDRRWDCSECAQYRWHRPNAEVCEQCAGRNLRSMLAEYDAAPRIEAKYKPAYERLRRAALAAGMSRNHGAAVVWARAYVERWS